MKFWFSGEVMADVADAYRDTRKDLEKQLNEALGSKDYGDEIREMALIAIIRSSDVDSSAYPEKVRYNRKDRQFEARLKIDHDAFMRASRAERRDLLLTAVRRAVDEMTGIGMAGDQLKRDLEAFAAVSS